MVLILLLMSILSSVHLKTFLVLVCRISSIESKSSHPMAAALVDYARRCKIEPTPDIVEHFHNFPGEGISGEVDGKELLIGNRKIAARAGCSAGVTLFDCPCPSFYVQPC